MTRRTCLAITCLQLLLLRHTDHQLTATVQGSGQPHKGELRFNLSRNPNPHLGFGGGGVHFCLGAHVARAQLRAIFGELLRQLPDIQAGDPAYVPGNFIHAVRSMPCTF